MYSTRRPGRVARIVSASLRPVLAGMTMSVRSRTSGPGGGVGGALGPGGRVHRGAAPAGLESLIPSRRQRAMRQAAQLVVVLDDQHGPTAAMGGARWRGLLEIFRQRLHRGQIDLERRALVGLAVDPDVAAALLHDAVHGR